MAVQGDLNTALLACFQNVASNSSDVLNLSDPRNGSVPHVHNAETCSFLVEQYTKQYDNSQYTRELVTYYLMGLGGMTMCGLGLVFNMISLIVLTHKSMRSSTYSYLSALSVCDSMVLVFTILLLVKDVDKPHPGEQRWPWDEGIYPYMFPYVHPAAFTFQVTSVWLTLAFTVDRYIMICHPFKAEPFCSISKARKVVLSLFISSLIFNLPKFFEYKTVAIHLPHLNTTKIGCDLTEFGRSHTFRELYHSWLYIMFVCGVPFVALAVLNAFLIHAVRLSRKRGREINAAEKKRNDTTVMLIGVVIIFFICQMPALVSRMIWAFEDNPDNFKALPLYTLNEIASFLIVLNSATNIVPYYFFGARFRKQFWRLFCYCFRNQERFNRLTRTFSLTMMDDEQRRVSIGSCRNNINVNDVGGGGAIEKKLAAVRDTVCLSMVGGNGKWTPNSGNSLVLTTVISSDAERSPAKVSELNGNFSDDEAAKHCLLKPGC
ncbi:hypothetical protein LSH36_360g02013 [Paralvinella palmiformis]|uniref:G-protein coupled receptors family 1 profile domain-containing protein n=1 Tax=Paralvinella palmiformis TaxID=53620 RepID=A0AAD9JFN4_9ANNE|nr:hypothetical protein LSH36_360g02013 [Paralvinella palmiformis]